MHFLPYATLCDALYHLGMLMLLGALVLSVRALTGQVSRLRQGDTAPERKPSRFQQLLRRGR